MTLLLNDLYTETLKSNNTSSRYVNFKNYLFTGGSLGINREISAPTYKKVYVKDNEITVDTSRFVLVCILSLVWGKTQ